MTIPLLLTVLRVVVGTILLFSGIVKLTSFSSFISVVHSYEMLPIGFVKPMSYLIVSTEITLGIALSIGCFSRGASLLASLLFLIFAVGLINVLVRELPVTDCGCANYLFSILDFLGLTVSNEPNWKIVLTDIILAGVSFGLACSHQRGYGLESFVLRETVEKA